MIASLLIVMVTPKSKHHHPQAKASSATYAEFQTLKSGVLQQSAEIVRQSEAMLELIGLMGETCRSGALDKPRKHIQVHLSHCLITTTILPHTGN